MARLLRLPNPRRCDEIESRLPLIGANRRKTTARVRHSVWEALCQGRYSARILPT